MNDKRQFSTVDWPLCCMRIFSNLDVFTMGCPEARCQCELLVRLGVRVKDLYIKKCLLSSALEVSGGNVESLLCLVGWMWHGSSLRH